VRNARNGKTFATNRVRHADLIRKMLTDLGEEEKKTWLGIVQLGNCVFV
jgi:uncharacterized protein (DUF1697 family)